MSGFTQILIDNKEVLGIAMSAVGVIKTAHDVIRSRSRASNREKLLLRIQGLMAVSQAASSGLLVADQQSTEYSALAKSQLADALKEFGSTSEKVREYQVLEERLTPLQSAFLLYRPIGIRGWISQVLSWLSALALALMLFGTWLPDDGDGPPSWTAFAHSWSDPNAIVGSLLPLGLFLLLRQWALSERRKTLRKRLGIARRHHGSSWETIAAVVYGLCGLASLSGAVVFARSDVVASVKFAWFGALIVGAGLALFCSGRLRTFKLTLRLKGALGLFAITVILFCAIVFDAGGIVLKEYRHDVLGYWRKWVEEPWIPMLFLSFAVLPLYAGARCVRSAWPRDANPLLEE